jgi:hypothetical protein
MIDGPAESIALAAVHGQVCQLIDRHPANLQSLVADGGFAGHVLSAIDDAELLPDLVIARVWMTCLGSV